jgi:putative transposase
MARLPRSKAAGYPHHVIQRGNNRQAVFLDVADYCRYLNLLHEISAAQEVAVHAYVLMTNHVHLLVTPEADDGLSRFMQALGRRYVRWFNDRHQRTCWHVCGISSSIRSAPVSRRPRVNIGGRAIRTTLGSRSIR